MNWEQFKRRLRSELPGHTSPVDADEIWAAIEPTVDQINSGGKVIYKRLGLLLLFITLVGGGVGVYALLDNQPRGQQASIMLQDVHEDGETGDQASRESVQQSADRVSEANDSGSDALNGWTDRKADSELLSERYTEHNSKTSTKANSNTERTSRIQAPGSVTSSDNSGLRGEDDSNNSTRKSDKENRNTYRQVAKLKNSKDVSQSRVRAADPNHALDAISEAFTSDANDGKTGRTAKRNGIQSTEVLMASVSAKSSVMLSNHNQTIQSLIFAAYNRISPTTDCPSFKPKNFSFLLGVHGGVSYPLRNLSSKEDGSELATRRDETESTMVSGNIGIDLLVRHQIGLEFGLGIQYLSLLERFDLERTVTTTEMEFGVQAISVNPLGDTTYITGMVPVTTTRTEKKRFYNKYKFTEIPITIGYSHEVKNWRIGGEAAVILGILTKTEGKVLDENEEIVDLNADHPSVSGAKFGASYYFGASLVHQFDSGFEMGLHPHARISPTDYSTADYNVRSKYVHIGLNVSVRYRFGR